MSNKHLPLARAPPVATAPGVCKGAIPICGVRSAALTSGVAACAVTAEFAPVERNAGVTDCSQLAAVAAASCRALGAGAGVCVCAGVFWAACCATGVAVAAGVPGKPL